MGVIYTLSALKITHINIPKNKKGDIYNYYPHLDNNKYIKCNIHTDLKIFFKTQKGI